MKRPHIQMPKRPPVTHEHQVSLQPGQTVSLAFRYPRPGTRGSLGLTLVAVHEERGQFDLAMDSLWGGYEMLLKTQAGDQEEWTPVWPGSDDQLRLSLALHDREQVYILSEGRQTHGLCLQQTALDGESVILTIVENA